MILIFTARASMVQTGLHMADKTDLITVDQTDLVTDISTGLAMVMTDTTHI